MALSPELIGALTGAGIGGLGLDIASGGRREGESSGERRKRFLGNLLQGGAMGGLAGAAAGSSYSQGGAMADIVNKLKETVGGPDKPAPGILQKTVNTPALAVNEVRNVLSYPYAIGATVAAAPALNLLRNLNPATALSIKGFKDAVKDKSNYPDLLSKLELAKGQGLLDTKSSSAIRAILNSVSPGEHEHIVNYAKQQGYGGFAKAMQRHLDFKKSPAKAIGRHVGRGASVGAAAYLADWLMRTRPTVNTPSLDEVGLNALNNLSQ